MKTYVIGGIKFDDQINIKFSANISWFIFWRVQIVASKQTGALWDWNLFVILGGPHYFMYTGPILKVLEYELVLF